MTEKEQDKLNRENTFNNVLNMMAKTYSFKNGKYGNSVQQLGVIVGKKRQLDNIATRIVEKALRISNALESGEDVKETISDNFLDIAVYGVMGVIENGFNFAEYEQTVLDPGKNDSLAVSTDNAEKYRVNDIVSTLLGKRMPAQKGITASKNPHAVIGVGSITAVGVTDKDGVKCIHVRWEGLRDVYTDKPLKSGDDMNSWYPIKELDKYGFPNTYNMLLINNLIN